MNKKLVGYWLTTALVALLFLAGGVTDVLGGPQITEGMQHLGYPPYFAAMLGVWKVLGALAVLAPGLPRLKEWAYAGFVFDLISAAWSHQASGDDFGHVFFPLALIALVLGSWALRPESRRLAG